jgi:carbon monoxide dehydrogenase subunit G
MHFEGDREFTLPAEAVFAKLRDAAFLVTCIPDATVIGQPARDQATCAIRPGFAFIRGTIDVTITFVSAEEPSTLRFQLSSKGIGTRSEVDTVLTIASRDGGGSRVHWTADVTKLGGLLVAVPTGLIRGAAQKTCGRGL